MNTQQIIAMSVLGVTMLLFIWGRIRYDLVGVLALLASVALGIVAPKDAFTGFSDDIIMIVASALIISAAISRSGLIEAGLQRVAGRLRSFRSQLMLLTASVAFLSALVKNIGALAMLMPAAMQMTKRSNSSPSAVLMPMSFASLLGGLITLVGTSPNIIVSRVRQQMTGHPFTMFDYAPVGLGLTFIGLLFLWVAYRLLPAGRRAAPTLGEALDITDYATEAAVLAGSPAEGLTIEELKELAEGEVEVTGLLSNGRRRIPLRDTIIDAGDIVIMQGEPEALERAIATAGLQLEGQHRHAATAQGGDGVGTLEAVVERGSVLAGQAAGRLGLHERYGVNLIAVSRRGERVTTRLRDVTLCPGDVIVLQGRLASLPEQLRELGCLPLAERSLRLGSARKGAIPLAILGMAMAATAAGLVPVGIAFFAAAALIMLTGGLPAREAYTHIQWPILVMLGALIPVSDALRTTGATDILAHSLSSAATTFPPWAAVGLIMAVAMAVTPFLNNAATVLVVAPVAGTFAGELGFRPEPFLMAVAVGAGCDFLTPFGHQCNTLVLGPGGYRFGDYARLGAPLSVIVLLTGVPLILAVWPLH